MDPLGPLLSTLQARGWIYCLMECEAPWGVRIPHSGAPQFHSVRSGRCWIVVEQHEPVRLRAGDFAVVTHGDEHYVADEPGGPVSELLDVVDPGRDPGRLVFEVGGEEGPGTELVCGGFQLTRPGRDPLAELPPLVVLRAGPTQPPMLESLVETAAVEIQHPRFGSATVLSSLGALLLVQTLRVAGDQTPAGYTGLLAAVRDDRVAAVLAAIHEQPEQPWTVDALADVAHVSRSTLTSTFKRLMGTTVTRYLVEWRMTTAAVLVEDTDLELGKVAAATGYGSEAAFSRAFRRYHRTPPGAYRRSRLAARARGDAGRRLPPLFVAAVAEQQARSSGGSENAVGRSLRGGPPGG